MKQINIFTRFLLAALVFISPNRMPAAGTDGQPLALLTEYRIYPGKAIEFSETVMQFMKWYQEYGLGYSIRVYSMDDYTGHTMLPLKNYADLDRMIRATAEVKARAGKDRWNELSRRKSACTSRHSSFILRHCPDISLKPKDRKYTLDASHFTYWGYYYLKPGMEPEFESRYRDIIAYYGTLDFKDIDHGWDFYRIEIGRDKPLYLMIHPGKDLLDFWQQAGKRHGIAGKKLDSLFGRVMETVRTFEVKTGDYLPELSFICQ